MKRFLVEVDTELGLGGHDHDLRAFIKEVVEDGLLLEEGVAVQRIEPYEISEYDRENAGDVILSGTWFTADLLRLIAKSDPEHKARIQIAFPEVVALYEGWVKG